MTKTAFGLDTECCDFCPYMIEDETCGAMLTFCDHKGAPVFPIKIIDDDSVIPSWCPLDNS